MQKQTLQWFKDRIGQEVTCVTHKGNAGNIIILDESIAGNFYSVAQNTFGWQFTDIETAAPTIKTTEI